MEDPIIDPESLPPVFPVRVASRILGVGKNQTYELISAGKYPVRVLNIGGRYRVSKADLLRYLGISQPADGAA
jgi:excisionase family DNA binding protein